MLAPRRGALLSYSNNLCIATFYNHIHFLLIRCLSTCFMMSRLGWWRHPLCVTSTGLRFLTTLPVVSGFLSYFDFDLFFPTPGSRSGVHQPRVETNQPLWRHKSRTYDVITENRGCATSAHARINHLDPRMRYAFLSRHSETKKRFGMTGIRTLDLAI